MFEFICGCKQAKHSVRQTGSKLGDRVRWELCPLHDRLLENELMRRRGGLL